ncbi:Sensory histidine kinase in two-component regulatory system with OmpR [gamma proteobacterium HdN1]|nr:Sensory histidine kinase in two-component regulatory system with OmpR [gamma proteobacterium HdN1]
MVLATWLIILLSQISTLWLSYYYFYLPGVKNSTELVAVQLETLQNGIAHAGKQPFLDELPSNTELIITDDPAVIPPAHKYRFTSFLTRPFRERLGRDVEIRLQFDPAPSIWFTRAELDGAWFCLPLPYFGRYQSVWLAVWLLGTPLLAFVVAALYVRQLNRPLRQLELAALRIGRGESVAQLKPAGNPGEFKAVTDAFNQMNSNLQQVERERQLLLAGISHDLRTPLTRMRLTAELLEASDPELTEGMVRDIEDMDAILDQFIAFVRDGRDEQVDVGDLNEVIEEVIAQYESEDVILRSDLQALPPISLKRLSLKRLFANLIGNALRHGGGEVDISSGVERGEIRLVVADRGPGLPVGDLQALLQPFARGDSSRGTKGSGLGLAIVKRVVDMHHGRIELRNRIGGGLEAVVWLPITGSLVPPGSLMKSSR